MRLCGTEGLNFEKAPYIVILSPSHSTLLQNGKIKAVIQQLKGKEFHMAKSKSTAKKSDGFTDEERAAMKERAKELKAEARRKKNREEGEADLLAKVDEMSEPDRAMAARVHEIVTETAPGLMPKTWYGMPAYANQDGKVVCFFQSAEKFKARYATFGFNDSANLDEGAMWPTSFALKELTPAAEERIAALVKQAVS
jgi:uncharacterized protein YdhG (YjbR/CyaY superfamily)